MEPNKSGESHHVERASTSVSALPVAPSMGPALEGAAMPVEASPFEARAVLISFLAVLIAVAAAFIAQALMHLIAFVTHLAFFHRLSFSMENAQPRDNTLGPWVIGVPIVGAVIVGFMARYGSKAIRGHGIPEAMEQVLTNQSRIPPRMTFLKPLSAAIAIGTGGPFGAEGPIIATGGALGSLVGQILHTTAVERKTLLAAGAAAGMAATFGSPVAAVLLAVELLLFEFRPRSLIPVALASSVAAAVRITFAGTNPVFAMPTITTPSGAALALYIAMGAVMGIIAVIVTRAVYAIEDAFEHLPIHWMWWPAVGAVAVGIIGYFYPRTLGVGYENITDILGGPNGPNWTLKIIAALCIAKFVSWAIYLGSGTSGGTLAPLFTIGGATGLLLGALANWLVPSAHVNLSIAALVGMAAIFAGSARALLASAVFAFETTLQPLGLLPLLGSCAAAYMVSSLLMRNTIMTEKIARRGVRVPVDYAPDFLDGVLVHEMMSPTLISLTENDTLGRVRGWIAAHGPGTSHQGFPVLGDNGLLVGVVTRRDLLNPEHSAGKQIRELIKRPPIIVYDDLSLRAAADHMVNHDVGRLPVVKREKPGVVVGMITRSDLLRAHRRRLSEGQMAPPKFRIGAAASR